MHLMSTSSGCLLEPATGFAGSLTTMASSSGFACASTSENRSSSVYLLNSLCDGVVGSTALSGGGGSHMTCLVAACFAASFKIVPVVAFSDRCLANGSITSVMHSEVRPAMSSSVPSFHSGHMVGALNRIQPSLLFGNLY